MRVLYLGDSHIKCMIDAASGLARETDMEEFFFGATIPQLNNNSFLNEGGYLVPSSNKVREMFMYTGGSETVDLKSFDACVLVGWCATVMFIFDLLGKRISYLPKHLFSLEQKNTQLLSGDAYRAYLRQGLQNFWKIYPLLKDDVGGRVLVLQRPIESELNSIHRQTRREDAPSLKRAIYSDLCTEYKTALNGLGVQFVPQPTETLTAQRATRRKYGIGSLQLYGNIRHPMQETSHMNESYGAICLRNIRAVLGAAGK